MTTRPLSPSRAEIDRFYQAIPVGAANARTAEAIAYQLGLIGEHATPAQIENARRRVRLYSQHAARLGYVYGADNRGYFRPTADEIGELSATLGRRRSQAVVTLEWLRQMEANINAAMRQDPLFDISQTAAHGGPTQVGGLRTTQRDEAART